MKNGQNIYTYIQFQIEPKEKYLPVRLTRIKELVKRRLEIIERHQGGLQKISSKTKEISVLF